MLNKHTRWFHSSRVKLPLVKISASWFLVSMYLIWILGTKLILSNNQSRATLWFLETYMSHYRASSLYNHIDHFFVVLKHTHTQQSFLMLPDEKKLTFEVTKSNLSTSSSTPWDCFRLCIVWGVERTSRLFLNGFHSSLWLWLIIRSHKSRAGTLSNLNPVDKGMISDSVELCETEVCFLHIQLIGTYVWLPKMHNVPPEVDFESSRSPAKSASWNSPSLQCLAVLPTWQYCLYSLVWWM